MPWVTNTISCERRCTKADVGDLSCMLRINDLLRAFYPPLPNEPGKNLPWQPGIGEPSPILSYPPPASMEYTVRTPCF
jgi:hypothetical protein